MKYYSLLLAFLCSIATQSQNSADAGKAIKEIKDGVIIVNLIHPQKKIEALYATGQEAEADKLEKKTKQRHKELMLAFEKNYTFSRLLFINSFDIEKLENGDPSVLFDAHNNTETDLPNTYYFVELGITSTQSLDGFVAKNAQRELLKKPFPYYINQWKALHIKKKTYMQMVIELNDSFTAFYKRVSQ